MSAQPNLFDLLDAEECYDPRAELVHVCLPTMAYMCGGSILGLADGGPGGHQVLGVGNAAWTWELVTCPDCRAPGHREVARVQHRQQKPESHVCDDTCAWTAIATTHGVTAGDSDVWAEVEE